MIEQMAVYIELVPLTIWIASAVLFIALWVNQRSHVKLQCLKLELKQVHNELKALTTTSLGLGGHVLALERQQPHSINRPTAKPRQKLQPVVKPRSAPQPVVKPKPNPQPRFDVYESGNQPYDHAIFLAQQGKGVHEITSICGISQSEAELIIMMHRLDQAS